MSTTFRDPRKPKVSSGRAMIAEDFFVNYSFLDWYGFSPTLGVDFISFSEGRIGRSDNPLKFEKRKDKVGKSIYVLTGGWKSKETMIHITPDIERIDLLLKDDLIYFLVRSGDEDEIYPDTYEHILSLAWKDEGNWYYAKPFRDETYKKDASTGQYYQIRRR